MHIGAAGLPQGRAQTIGAQMFFPISSWFPAFAATLLIEAPIVGLLFRGVAQNLGALAVVFVFANLATHLALWYVATQILMPGSLEYLLAGEGWAIGGEALLFWAAIPGLSPRRALLAAVAANLASFALGLAVQSVWPDILA